MGVALSGGAVLCRALCILFRHHVVHLDGGTAVPWGPGAVVAAGVVDRMGVAVLSSMITCLLEMRALRHLV